MPFRGFLADRERQQREREKQDAGGQGGHQQGG